MANYNWTVSLNGVQKHSETSEKLNYNFGENTTSSQQTYVVTATDGNGCTTSLELTQPKCTDCNPSTCSVTDSIMFGNTWGLSNECRFWFDFRMDFYVEGKRSKENELEGVEFTFYSEWGSEATINANVYYKIGHIYTAAEDITIYGEDHKFPPYIEIEKTTPDAVCYSGRDCPYLTKVDRKDTHEFSMTWGDISCTTSHLRSKTMKFSVKTESANDNYYEGVFVGNDSKYPIEIVVTYHCSENGARALTLDFDDGNMVADWVESVIKGT